MQPRYWTLRSALLVVTSVIALGPLVPAVPLHGQARGGELALPLHLSAVAQDLDRGTSTPLRITVERWSTASVRDQLVTPLRTDDTATLLEALRKAPTVGSIRTTTSLAWDLHFASVTPGEDGGYQVVLGTDRPLAFSEQWNNSRTLDYPFTVVELHLDRDGTGEGAMSYATKVTAAKDSNNVVLENWGTQRVRLTQVRREKD